MSSSFRSLLNLIFLTLTSFQTFNHVYHYKSSHISSPTCCWNLYSVFFKTRLIPKPAWVLLDLNAACDTLGHKNTTGSSGLMLVVQLFQWFTSKQDPFNLQIIFFYASSPLLGTAGPYFWPQSCFLSFPQKLQIIPQAVILTFSNRIEISHEKQQQIKRC